MSFKSLMKYKCTISRPTKVNTDGEIKNVYAELSENVRCHVEDNKGKIETTQAGEFLEYTSVGYFLPKQDLRPRGAYDLKDTIEITKPAFMAGTKYQVIHVADESGRGHHLVAYLKRVNQ